MIKIEEIEAGVVAWPDPSYLTAESGCSLPYSLHRSLHPMLCIEKDADNGVWIALSSRNKTAAGRAKMEIPRSWKIGSVSWLEKSSFVGDLTTSAVVPHEVMEKATERAEFLCQLRHRVKPSGVSEILKMVKRAEGKTLASVKVPTAYSNDRKPKVILRKEPVVPSVQCRSNARATRVAAHHYEEVLARLTRGESAEEIAKSSVLSASRIKSYLARHRRKTQATTGISVETTRAVDGSLDLANCSMEDLRQLLAQKERDQRKAALSQLEDVARGFGFEVASVELVPLTSMPTQQVT